MVMNAGNMHTGGSLLSGPHAIHTWFVAEDHLVCLTAAVALKCTLWAGAVPGSMGYVSKAARL